MICPDCKNSFLQPFVCTTCGAEKLYDTTVVTLQNQLAAAQVEIKMLRGKCAAIEGDEIGNPCVALSDALEQRDKLATALRELDLTGIKYQEKPVDAVGRMRGIAMRALNGLP
jgi:hypothetical protein